MSTFTLSISFCLTTFNFPLFVDLTPQVPMQYYSLQHRTLLLSPVPSTTECCFCFGCIPSFFLELFLHWSPVAYLAPTDLGSSSFSILWFCLLILLMGFSRQKYWRRLPFPSPVDHILSDLSIMTWLSCGLGSAPAAIDWAEAWQWETTPRPRSGVATKSTRLQQCRSSGREELPHVRGQGLRLSGPDSGVPPPRSSCCRAQEDWEELLHIQGQEGQLWEDTPPPR